MPFSTMVSDSSREDSEREAVAPSVRSRFSWEVSRMGFTSVVACGRVRVLTRKIALACVVSSVVSTFPTRGQDPTERDAVIRGHLRALEEAGQVPAEELLASFDREHFAKSYLENTTVEQRRAVLAAVRAAALDSEDVLLERRGLDHVLVLRGGGTSEVVFRTEPETPYGIVVLSVQQVEEPGAPLELTRENLAETFDRLEEEGLSGVIHVVLGGELLLERGFGQANPELGIANTLETVFGTGSRPIDYTIAAIQLLDQHGELDLGDTLPNLLSDVPADKESITLRHLMTGRSGLPDFVHTVDDWDADLQWIDRSEFERRVLQAELLFRPGTRQRHSHAAFGLLAAVIEHVTGEDYAEFLRENFFDPAGMTRTGEYGETRGLALTDFAVGGGPQFVGLPNIPPNWGKTSWLVKGSGGMYSTLGDLQRFYTYLRSGEVLDEEHSAPFRAFAGNSDGSDRGFELFSLTEPARGTEIHLFLNSFSARDARRLRVALDELRRSE